MKGELVVEDIRGLIEDRPEYRGGIFLGMRGPGQPGEYHLLTWGREAADKDEAAAFGDRLFRSYGDPGRAQEVKADFRRPSEAAATLARLQKLELAIKEVHRQRADDRCWMDLNRLFELVGLLPADRRVGDKFEMLKNCVRFVETQCTGGGWPSYASLERAVVEKEEVIRRLAVEKSELLTRCDGLERRVLTAEGAALTVEAKDRQIAAFKEQGKEVARFIDEMGWQLDFYNKPVSVYVAWGNLRRLARIIGYKRRAFGNDPGDAGESSVSPAAAVGEAGPVRAATPVDPILVGQAEMIRKLDKEVAFLMKQGLDWKAEGERHLEEVARLRGELAASQEDRQRLIAIGLQGT